MKVGVKVDGVMVLVGIAALGGLYLYTKRNDLIAAVDPTNPDNVVNNAAKDLIGEDRLAYGFDRFFGAIDLLNPLAPESRKQYARQIYGVNNGLD